MDTLNQKVLIVDDEPRNQRIAAEVLEDQVEIKLASTGEEALKILQDYLPDLVLLDIMMPGIDGYEACKRIKEDPRLSMTKVILVSGKAMIDERLKGYACGADDYITKPYAIEEFLAKCQVYLRLVSVQKEYADLNHSLEKKVQERTQKLLSTEAMLVSSAKMAALGEMAGGIAHEINTPLSIVGMISDQIKDLIIEEPVNRQEIVGLTEILMDTVQKMSKTIHGLRTFSRDASQDRFVPATIKSIVDDVLILCAEKLKYSSIVMDIESISKDLSIDCRSVQVSQVLINLISNACDAIETISDKWIKIEAKKGSGKLAGKIEIVVTDSGTGIAPKVLEKIFQPFFTTKDVGKGTGLGLSISKGIVEAHHGEIYVDTGSRNTRFVIHLPIIQDNSAIDSA